MGFYSNTRDVSLSRRGTYLCEGQPAGTKHTFKVQIDTLKETPPGGHGDTGSIVEFIILESTFPQGNPVGSRAGWFVSQTRLPKMALADIMKFTCALLGGDPRVDEEVKFLGRGKLMQWIFDATQNQPLLEQKEHMIMTIDTSTTNNKNKPGVFTHYNFRKNDSPPDIESIIQSLGLLND